MKNSSIQISKQEIEKHFDGLPKKAYLKKEIVDIFEANRKNWRLGQSLAFSKFLAFLLEQSKLKKHTLKFWNREVTRYIWRDISIYPILNSLNRNSYYSHYTSMYFHNLTNQIPKVIYINFEQTPKPRPALPLEQSNLDRAFKNKQRTSNSYLDYEDFKVCILSGKFTGRLGVIEMTLENNEKIMVTDIERTLIDICVRPAYAGGVYEVFRAFQAAREKASSNRISAMLKKLEYIYPYHQAIGFYMMRAGYSDTALSIFRDFGFKYDFYLTHNMKEMEYDEKWKLFYPKGF